MFILKIGGRLVTLRIDPRIYLKKEAAMTDVERQLGERFICSKCKQHRGSVQKLAMSGTGITRLFEVQPYRYAFVSCDHCGYTEIFNLRTLEGKDNLGTILEVLFSD
jgi:uncharacterized protein